MKKLLVLFLIVTFSAVAEENRTVYGSQPKLEGPPLNLSDAIQPARLNKLVKVSAQVKSVCQNRGCWMVISDHQHQMRVTFKDYGFFVPKDIQNKEVIVEGIISASKISEAEARHYAEDAGKSKEEIEQIKGDQPEYRMVAESVVIAK